MIPFTMDAINHISYTANADGVFLSCSYFLTSSEEGLVLEKLIFPRLSRTSRRFMESECYMRLQNFAAMYTRSCRFWVVRYHVIRHADISEHLFGFIIHVSEHLPVCVVWVNIQAKTREEYSCPSIWVHQSGVWSENVLPEGRGARKGNKGKIRWSVEEWLTVLVRLSTYSEGVCFLCPPAPALTRHGLSSDWCAHIAEQLNSSHAFAYIFTQTASTGSWLLIGFVGRYDF
jgi:hypothetical protein